MNKEVRTLSNVELRADDSNPQSRTIEGYAIRFEEWSRDLGGFTEIIKAGAISDALLAQADVVMNINHDDDKMVARYRRGQGTLLLELRSDGVYFCFDAPTTPLGDELLYNVRNGNLFECSFAFSLDPSNTHSERWYREADNSLKREILEINGLYDCSIVTHAAYPTTSCSARSEEIKLQISEVDKAMDAIVSEIDNL